jgi:hypothetical protein
MYWLRLRSPGKSKVFSLRTADKLAAEMIAAPLIADHKAALLAAKPRIEFVWRQAYTSGLHDTPDGKVFATDRELHYLDATGATIRTAPNGGHEHRIVSILKVGLAFSMRRLRSTTPHRCGHLLSSKMMTTRCLNSTSHTRT